MHSDGSKDLPAAGESLPRVELLCADWMAGSRVVDPHGADVGELVHVMVDVARGLIAYAVLCSAPLLGSDQRLAAVPWRMLTFDADAQRFVTDLDADDLRAAPQRQRGEWPLRTDAPFVAQLYNHYGAPPG
jgi:hypothetical protein